MPLDGEINDKTFRLHDIFPHTEMTRILAGLQHENGEQVRTFMHGWIKILQMAASNPFNPLLATIPAQMLQGKFAFWEHVLAPHNKHEFDFTLLDQKSPRSMNGAPIGTDIEIVDEKPYGRLKRIILTDENGEQITTPRPPMLLIVPMSGHFDSLLTGTVHELMMDFDLYVTDWQDVKHVPLSAGEFTLDTYISYLKDDWLPLINMRHHGDEIPEQDMSPMVHTMAVCQPGVPLLAAASLMAEDNSPHRPLSMTMMGSPIDTRISPTAVNKFAEKHDMSWFENQAVIQIPPGYNGAGQTVYPGKSQLYGFMFMHLTDHLLSHHDMMLGMTFAPFNETMEALNFDRLAVGDAEDAEMKKAFYEEYKTVMDTAGAYYLQTIQTVFKDHLLPQGRMVYTDPETGQQRPVRPESITDIALLTLEGEKDDITGRGQTRAAHTLTPNLPAQLKAHYEQNGVGHYGLFNGGRFRKHIAPRIVAATTQADRHAGWVYPMRSEILASFTREGLIPQDSNRLDLTA